VSVKLEQGEKEAPEWDDIDEENDVYEFVSFFERIFKLFKDFEGIISKLAGFIISNIWLFRRR